MKCLSLIKNKSFRLVSKKRNKLNNKEYRIQIYFSGICSSDIPRAFENKAYHYPLVLGHEFSGKIIEVGPHCTQYEKNQFVSVFPLIPCFIHKRKVNQKCDYCKQSLFNLCKNYKYYGSRNDGSFSEEIVVNEWNIFKVPKNISKKSAALIEPISVSSNIVNKIINNSSLEKKKILVIGAGFIGQITSKLIIKYFPKSKLYVCDRNKFKLDLIKSKTIDTIHLKNNKETDYFVKSFIEQFDVVIELTGSSHLLNESIKLVKKNGKLIIPSNFENKTFLKEESVLLIPRKEIVLQGSWNSKFDINNNDWKMSLKFLKKNNIENLITHQTNLENAKELITKIYNRKKINGFRYIKAIIQN